MDSQLISYLESYGLQQVDQAIEPMIEVQLFSNPAITDQAIADAIVGFIKHNYIRAKVGWVADFVMPFIEPGLRAEIAKDIPIVKAQIATPAPKPPVEQQGQQQ